MTHTLQDFPTTRRIRDVDCVIAAMLGTVRCRIPPPLPVVPMRPATTDTGVDRPCKAPDRVLRDAEDAA